MLDRIKKLLSKQWDLLFLHASSELWRKKEPARLLAETADKIMTNMSFRLTPYTKDCTIFTPKSAEKMTEEFEAITKNLKENKMLKSVLLLGPFKRTSALEFLVTDTGFIKDGYAHVIFHIAVIKEIAIYVMKGPQENVENNRYNLRVLEPVITDLQLYLDSIVNVAKDYQSKEHNKLP